MDIYTILELLENKYPKKNYHIELFSDGSGSIAEADGWNNPEIIFEFKSVKELLDHLGEKWTAEEILRREG